MRDIFTELYKKVLGFFQSQDENKENVKEVAYNRLKLVLMQDRTNLTPYLLERMRGEMIDVLSKYVEMDKEALELNFEQEGEQMALMLSIPVLRAKDEEEIKAVLDAQDKDTEESEETEDSKENEECLCENCTCEICECTNDECACPDDLEDVCGECDCEFKEQDIDCEECSNSSVCECKQEIDECKQEVELSDAQNEEVNSCSPKTEQETLQETDKPSKKQNPKKEK